MKSGFLYVVIAFVFTLTNSVARSQENFYSNKTIRILVQSAGSSYDAYARLVARYLPAHLPATPQSSCSRCPVPQSRCRSTSKRSCPTTAL